MENRNRIHWNNEIREIIQKDGIAGLKAMNLNVTEARNLIDYLKKMQFDYLNTIDGIIRVNPKYDYPNEYLGNEVHYWKERISNFNTNYYTAEKCIQILSEYRSKLLNPENSTMPTQQSTKPEPNETKISDKIDKLKTIWLPQAKISIDDFAQNGIDKGLWNDKLEIITSRGSLYGTGKTMLASIFISFKGWAISSEIHHKVAGKLFCETFGIEIKETTKEPYKAFSSGDPKLIKQFKRTFNIENS